MDMIRTCAKILVESYDGGVRSYRMDILYGEGIINCYHVKLSS